MGNSVVGRPHCTPLRHWFHWSAAEIEVRERGADVVERLGLFLEGHARDEVGHALVHGLVHVEIKRGRICISGKNIAGEQNT